MTPYYFIIARDQVHELPFAPVVSFVPLYGFALGTGLTLGLIAALLYNITTAGAKTRGSL